MTSENDSSTIGAALALARQGFAVFPLKPNDKAPFQVKDIGFLAGCTEAETSPEAIRTTWGRLEGLGIYDANIGIEATRSGLVLVDVDMKAGRDGLRSLSELERKHGKLPCTLSATTPNDGLHFYYRLPAGQKAENASDHPAIGDGIEIRANNLYLVAPPSSINGKEYMWIDPATPIADCPQWLIDLSKLPTKNPHTKRPTSAQADIAAIPTSRPFQYSARDVIERFNQNNRIEDTLRRYGYTEVGNNFWQHPHNDTSNSVHVLNDTFSCHFGARDPLKGQGVGKDNNSFTSFHIVTAKEYGGDFKASIKAISAALGMNTRAVEDVGDITSLNWGAIAPESQPEALAVVARPTPAAEQGDGVFLTPFSEIIAREVEWLVHKRIPLGKVTIFAGEGGTNKSTVAYDLACRISRGGNEPLSDKVMAMGDCILVAGDDEPDVDIQPRLSLMGGDLSRIFIMDIRKMENGCIQKRAFDLSDIPSLRAGLKQKPQARMVVIDPVSAFIGKKDANKHADVYSLVQPLGALAAEFRVSIILVAHTNKTTNASFRNKVSGSTAWTDAARATYLFTEDPSDTDLRVMSAGKINAARKARALLFRVIEVGDTIKIEWESEVDTTADKVLQETKATTKDATDWLRDFLSEGEKLSSLIFTKGGEDGYTRDQLYSAKNKLGAKARKVSMAQGWSWRIELEQPATKSQSQIDNEPIW